MPNPPFTPTTIYESLAGFDAGVNTGVRPQLLKPNELGSGVNLTVRGGFPTNRPPYFLFTLDYGGNSFLQDRVENGRFQGADYYKPDTGPECLIAAIGGRLFRFDIGKTSAKVSEITISASTVTTQPFAIPPVNSTVVVVLLSTVNIHPNTDIVIGDNNYTVVSVDSPTNITVTNVDGTPGDVIPIGSTAVFWDVNPATRTQTWMWQAEKWMIINDGQSVPIFYNGAGSRRSNVNGAPKELPAARMGCYGMGRVWQAGTDGRTFLAGDIVGGPSGTPAENDRDAVLRVTENTFLAGGGLFTVPGNVGDIQAMVFTAILDTSLGQGPLAVLTDKIVFSCSAGTGSLVDRTTWATTTNPILTESQIGNGGLGQWSTILVNGDVIYRSRDGIRSLILGRRDFATWGNVPISREVNLYLFPDDQTLLRYGSSIYFNNRTIMTFSPAFTQHGIYHRGLIALDHDIISSLRGKAPSVYDGAWTGLQALQLVQGDFSAMPRAFAFNLSGSGTIELWEIQSDQVQPEDNNDNDAIPIVWFLDTPQFWFPSKGIGKSDPKRLMDGELYVNDLIGNVSFQVYWRPDDYQCWTPWHQWKVCAGQQTCQLDPVTGCLPMNNYQPQYRPRMGFGEPDPNACDLSIQKPLREGYGFQVRVMVEGHCRIMGMRLMAVSIDQQAFAEKICLPNPPACDTLLPP